MICSTTQRIQDLMEEWLDELDPNLGAKLAALTPQGDHRRFLVSRLGGTGSTWLSWALNSHPDVFVTHEGILASTYPRMNYGLNDLYQFSERISNDQMHGSYKAVGDVGSAWIGQTARLPETFTTALLVRHPASTLSTLMRYAKRFDLNEIQKNLQTEQIHHVFGLDPKNLEASDCYFLHLATMWLCSVVAVRQLKAAGQIIRIEDCATSEGFSKIAKDLTGLEYPPTLIRHLVSRRMNAHRQAAPSFAQIWAEFPKRWKVWFEESVEPVALQLGYTRDPELQPIVPVQKLSHGELLDFKAQPLNGSALKSLSGCGVEVQLKDNPWIYAASVSLPCRQPGRLFVQASVHGGRCAIGLLDRRGERFIERHLLGDAQESTELKFRVQNWDEVGSLIVESADSGAGGIVRIEEIRYRRSVSVAGEFNSLQAAEHDFAKEIRAPEERRAVTRRRIVQTAHEQVAMSRQRARAGLRRLSVHLLKHSRALVLADGRRPPAYAYLILCVLIVLIRSLGEEWPFQQLNCFIQIVLFGGAMMFRGVIAGLSAFFFVTGFDYLFIDPIFQVGIRDWQGEWQVLLAAIMALGFGVVMSRLFTYWQQQQRRHLV